jgi:hypothetical protein
MQASFKPKGTVQQDLVEERSLRTLAGLRFHTVTLNPFFRRLRAIAIPITPNPKKPTSMQSLPIPTAFTLHLQKTTENPPNSLSKLPQKSTFVLPHLVLTATELLTKKETELGRRQRRISSRCGELWHRLQQAVESRPEARGARQSSHEGNGRELEGTESLARESTVGT